jgi:2-amino-4-hydroxy-6-hydroxymethyldihydropteridine diphosphokinase
MNRTVVALGGNLPFEGQGPRCTFGKALTTLYRDGPHRLRAVARLWQSAPVRAEGPEFLNTVAWVDTPLSAVAWLEVLLSIEKRFGRLRPESHQPSWLGASSVSAARTLDLDLIWYEGQQSVSDRLVLPHPRAAERGFVLGPLCDLPHELIGDIRLVDPQTRQLVAVEKLWADYASEGPVDLAPVETTEPWYGADTRENPLV